MDVAGDLPKGETSKDWFDKDVVPGIRYQYMSKVYRGEGVDSSNVDSGYVTLVPPDSVVVIDNGLMSDRIKMRIYSDASIIAVVDTVYIKRCKVHGGVLYRDDLPNKDWFDKDIVINI